MEEEFVDKKSSLAGDKAGLVDDSDEKYVGKYDDDKYSDKYEDDTYSPDEFSHAESHKSSPLHTAGTVSQYSSNYEEDVTATRSHTPSATRSHTPSDSFPVYIEASDVEEDLESDV